MQLFNFVAINIYAILVLVYILAHTMRYDRPASIQHWLFVGIVLSLMFILFADAGAWVVYGQPGHSAYVMNYVFNILLFALSPIPPALWYMYSDYQIFHSVQRIKRASWFINPIIFVHVVLSVVSPFLGWYFFIDPNNIYHRGMPGFYLVFLLLTIGPVLFVFVKTLVHRKRIEKRYLPALLLFAVPPLVGTTIQVLIFGVNILWSCAVLSVLHIFISVQNHRLNTDFLTGAYNRRQLSHFMKELVAQSTLDTPFGGIMLDLDDFKKINDTFGHAEGDRALEETVKLIRQSLREQDLVFRYGGDEFLAILETHTLQDLEAAVARIRSTFERFNASAAKPYPLSPSIGCLPYERDSGMKPDEYIDQLDKMMYQAKNRLKG